LLSRKRAEGIKMIIAMSAGMDDNHPTIALEPPNRRTYVALNEAAALSTATQRISTYKYQKLRSFWL
jgi:hypothetical protein